MPRGVKPTGRPAGRPKGKPNKSNALLKAEIAASGPTPLQIMIKHMRLYDEEANQFQADVDALSLKIRQLRPGKTDKARAEAVERLAGMWAELDHLRAEARRARDASLAAADKAAPYSHNRLSAIEYPQNPGGAAAPIEHRVIHVLSPEMKAIAMKLIE